MTRKELLIKAMNFEEVPRVLVSTLSGATWAIKQEGISPEELLRLPENERGRFTEHGFDMEKRFRVDILRQMDTWMIPYIMAIPLLGF